MRVNLSAIVAFVGMLWAGTALADCTLPAIDVCTGNDPAAAEQLLLRTLATNRTPRLLGQMAEFYRNAPPLFQDKSKYAWYLRRAADAGDPPSMLAYADLLIRGDGTLRDPDRAVELLITASKAGLTGPAYFALGQYYLSLDDKDRGLDALNTAAQYGDNDALALLTSLEPDKYPPAPSSAKAAKPPVAQVLAKPPKPELRPTASAASGKSKPASAEVILPGRLIPRACVGTTLGLPTDSANPADVSVGVSGGAKPSLYDPPSTLAGSQLTLMQVINAAYDGGFQTEDKLLAATGLAIAESGLWTAARNWKPEQGYRDASDVIGVRGPPEVWSNGRQMHADRGVWQISSRWWSQYPDSAVDDPVQAAAIAYVASDGGCNFSAWNSFMSGAAQKHFDEPFDGWPALRPVIRDFLAKKASAAPAVAKNP